MARISGNGYQFGQLLVSLYIAWLIATAIADHFHIKHIFGVLIVFGIYLGLVGIGVTAIKVSAVIKRNKRCVHGIRRGTEGGCENCIADEERRKTEWESKHAEFQRKEKIKEEAKALRREELQALTFKWLSRSESYRLMNPQRFEDSVAVLFRQLGYEVKQTPYSNDRGKDAIAWKDGKKYLIECKHYGAEKLIGRRDLQIFVAAMKEEKADAGFYVNTGKFARTAVEYAAQNEIQLYDGEKFPVLVNAAFPVTSDITNARVMCLECGEIVILPISDAPSSGTCAKGHSVTNDIIIERLLNTPLIPLTMTSGPPHLPDLVCDRCHSKMRVVNGRRGKFWGCTQYPKCRWTKRYQP